MTADHKESHVHEHTHLHEHKHEHISRTPLRARACTIMSTAAITDRTTTRTDGALSLVPWLIKRPLPSLRAGGAHAVSLREVLSVHAPSICPVTPRSASRGQNV
jgi:hypothetical protein